MENTPYRLIGLDDSFESATENMRFDEQLVDQLQRGCRLERFYIWQVPGITYSYKQECPVDMRHIDSSSRLTGGGIVFHTPGDIVFSLVGWNTDPLYACRMKGRLDVVSKRIQVAFNAMGVSLDQNANAPKTDLNFCASYPTPFEISIQNQKVVGLTIRQFKDRWLIQGVIHTQPTDAVFFNLNRYPVNIKINASNLLSFITSKKHT